MKKLSGIILALLLAGILAGPIVANGQTTTTSAQILTTLQAQIATLKAKIAELTAQLESLKKAQGEVKDASQDIKDTLRLIRNLKEGMSGDDIKILQELLASDPDVYPEGLITGYFGKATQRAVKRLQKRLCIDQVGQVGPQTMARINELLREGAGKSYGGKGGHVPAGLLRAPGIQKKLCGTSTPATTTPATTTDTVAPVISGIVATATTATSVQINWATNELADSKVWYGTVNPVVTATPTAVVSSSIYALNHTMTLSGLTPTTTYYYVVVSADQAGNTATGAQQSFTTTAQ